MPALYGRKGKLRTCNGHDEDDEDADPEMWQSSMSHQATDERKQNYEGAVMPSRLANATSV